MTQNNEDLKLTIPSDSELESAKYDYSDTPEYDLVKLSVKLYEEEDGKAYYKKTVVEFVPHTLDLEEVEEFLEYKYAPLTCEVEEENDTE